VTHDATLAARCDRLIELEEGHVVTGEQGVDA
jgi:predicted ABC-type transport system involved in lysophospholipase L1 biosynthesis ATPase subunit